MERDGEETIDNDTETGKSTGVSENYGDACLEAWICVCGVGVIREFCTCIIGARL